MATRHTSRQSSIPSNPMRLITLIRLSPSMYSMAAQQTGPFSRVGETHGIGMLDRQCRLHLNKIPEANVTGNLDDRFGEFRSYLSVHAGMQLNPMLRKRSIRWALSSRRCFRHIGRRLSIEVAPMPSWPDGCRRYSKRRGWSTLLCRLPRHTATRVVYDREHSMVWFPP